MNTIHKNNNFVVRTIEDEAFLLDTKTGNMHVLNRTARDIWNILDKCNTIDKVVEIMHETYGDDVDINELRVDVNEIIENYKQHNLIMECKKNSNS